MISANITPIFANTIRSFALASRGIAFDGCRPKLSRSGRLSLPSTSPPEESGLHQALEKGLRRAGELCTNAHAPIHGGQSSCPNDDKHFRPRNTQTGQWEHHAPRWRGRCQARPRRETPRPGNGHDKPERRIGSGGGGGTTNSPNDGTSIMPTPLRQREDIPRWTRVMSSLTIAKSLERKHSFL